MKVKEKTTGIKVRTEINIGWWCDKQSDRDKCYIENRARIAAGGDPRESYAKYERCLYSC